MKVVIYYEGPSERNMLKHLVYQSCQPTKVTEDYLDFLTTPNNGNAILFYNCEGCQNVFPAVAETPHYYSNDEKIIIIRDLETTKCFTLLKDELFEYCPDLPKIYARPIFAKTKLEHLYFADLNTFKRVFLLMYKAKFGKQIPDNNRFEEIISNFDPIKPDIKELFKAYNMAFSKPAIADAFFARFDFKNSNHPYFARLVDSLKEVIQVIQ